MADILGTPEEIADISGSYAAEAGSNRTVVMLAALKTGTGQDLTSITWNGVVRTPVVTINDSASENRDSVGICVFKESEIPGGASTATAIWASGATQDISIFCYTVGDVDQSTTVRTSGSAQGVVDGSGLTSSIAQTVTVGDLQLGIFAGRQNVVGSLVPQNSWTEDFDVLSTGGNNGTFGTAHFTAVGTSSPFQYSDGNNACGYAMATIALIPYSGGASPIPQLLLLGAG